MSETKLLFSTKRNLTKFATFFEKKENQRILFSGAFGAGKTTFLKEYFDQNHNVFHLFPVNYSVASNEDIFELIKYDLLHEILKPERNVVFEKNDFDKLFKWQYFIWENKVSILKPFIKFFPKIGKSLSDVIDNVEKIVKDFENETSYNEEQRIENYLKEIRKSNAGKIYEEDFFTQLLQEKIESLKPNGETILIIDDLDRIDPEHIFRILNIFAAHFDIDKNQNKFGFDKIILVCHVENIKSIFHHKYGDDTDFNGYLNKFFSNQIYTFSLQEEISLSLALIAKSIKINGHNSTVFELTNYYGDINPLFEIILSGLIKSGQLNTRSIIKLENQVFNYNYYPLDLKNSHTTSSIYYQLLNFFDLAKFLVGDETTLSEVLNKLGKSNVHFRELNISQDSFEDALAEILLFATYSQHKLYIEGEYDYKFNGMTISYKMGLSKRIPSLEIVKIKGDLNLDLKISDGSVNIYALLNEAFMVVENLKIAK